MGRKGNLAVFESSNISETREVTPTKISVHVCYINLYLHEFYNLWSEREILLSLNAKEKEQDL